MIMLEEILSESPIIHVAKNGAKVSYATTKEALRFIYSHCRQDMKTIETGCGLSTVVFSLLGCQHTCITPNAEHVRLVKEYCFTKEIGLNSVEFISGRSERILPNLSVSNLDFAFIDGGHAFPIPYLDWFYINERMRLGGVLGIDDIQIPTVKILNKFLDSSPEYTGLYKERKVAFYRKVSDQECSEWDYWTDQPFNRSFVVKLRKIVRLINIRKEGA